eukprot:27859_1
MKGIFETDQTSLLCNTQANEPNISHNFSECGQDVSKCSHAQRLKKTFEIYHSDPNVEKLNAVGALNDFHHLMFHHDEQFNDIFVILGGDCNTDDINKCPIYTRNFRDRTRNNEREKGDSAEIQILNKIHCHYRHAFDIGVRFTPDELALIETDESDEKAQQNNETSEFMNSKILKMKHILNVNETETAFLVQKALERGCHILLYTQR